MGSYEAKVYLDNQILKTIEIKNDTPLSEIRSSCENNSDFDNNSYYYYFLSKNGDILKRDSTFTAKDVVQYTNNEYRIIIKSVQFSFKANIYIDNQLIKNIKVTKETTLSKVRSACDSYFKKGDNNYYFISSYGNIIKNDSDFTVEKVWVKENDNEYKIRFQSEKIKYMVKVYIDNIYKTNINITKDTQLSEIRVLCQSIIFPRR